MDVDPALMQDRLPQPYRMLSKIIEEYIFDPAWLEITRLHPELLQNSDGQAFATPHNKKLDTICTPTMVTEQEFAGTSIIEKENLLFMSTHSSAFVVMDPQDGKIVQSIVLEEPRPVVEVGTEPAPDDQQADAFAQATNMWISAVSDPQGQDRLLTFSVVSIVEKNGDAEPEDGKSKKKGKNDPPQEPVKVPSCRVVVVQVKLGRKERFKPGLIELNVIAQVFVPLRSFEMDAIANVDVSMDGLLLSISTDAAISLYKLPKHQTVTHTALGSVEKIEEHDDEHKEDPEGEEEGEKIGFEVLEPVLSMSADADFDGNKLRRVSFFPLYQAPANKAKASNETVTALPSPEEESESANADAEAPVDKTSEKYYRVGLTIIFDELNEWWMMGMTGFNKESETNKVQAHKLLSWELASAASCVVFDDQRSTLLLGMRDGSVGLYNLATRALTSIVARHERAVTAARILKFVGKSGEDEYYIVTGAADGSLCFFVLWLPPTQPMSDISKDMFVGTTGVRSPSMGGGGPVHCLRTDFLSFRLDVNAGTSIVNIRSLHGFPWALVQCSDGMCAVYDVQNALLLGRLALYSGMTSRQVKWKLMQFEQVIKDLPAAQNDAPPAEDDLGYPINEKATVHNDATKEEENTEPETYDDPNMFLRAPPGKRAAKYAIDESFRWGFQTLRDSVAVASTDKYHCMFYRNDLPVLATFSAEDLLLCFHSKLMSTLNVIRTDSVSTYRRLQPNERLNPQLALQAINQIPLYDEESIASSMGGIGMRRPTSTQGAPVGSAALGSAASKRTQSGGAQGHSTSGTSRGKSGGTNSTQSTSKITKKNLEALQQALTQPTRGTNLDKGGILQADYERLMDPKDKAKVSARQSNTDRGSRKVRLLNRLSSIGNAF